MKHHETLAIRCDDIGARCGDIGAWRGDIGARRGDIDVRRGDIGARAEFPAILVRSFRDIGDCGVGITPQMCNRVTNDGDMGTFSKPEIS